MLTRKTLILARESGFLKLVPKRLKRLVKARLGFGAIHRWDWERAYDTVLNRAQRVKLATERKACIVYDGSLLHSYYEAACLELGVPYVVLDLNAPDWVEKVTCDDSDIYFLRPFVLSSFWRSVSEERAYFIVNVLKRPLFPELNALWIYESKRRCSSLLQHYGVPHPKTWVFLSRSRAEEFLAQATYPLVFKTDIGSDAIGVRILYSRSQAQRIVRECFDKGFRSDFYDPRDRNYGQVFFQEYLPDVSEWRVIRIGDSYFAHRKGKKGSFHSGSKITEYRRPTEKLLEFVRHNLDTMGINSAAVDTFEDRSGRFFVNEVQTYYGATESGQIYRDNNSPIVLGDNDTIEMMIDGRPGRYYYSGGDWAFEEGDFARNAGCNLRVRLAFQVHGWTLPGYRV